jgi:hypothetical protein
MEKLVLAMAEFFECEHDWVLAENKQRELTGEQEYEKAAIERDKCWKLRERMKKLREVIVSERKALAK